MRWRTTVCSMLLLVCGFDLVRADVRFEFAETHMGTRFRIVVYAPSAETATLASTSAFERIRKLDAIMSDYLETSELMSLCRQAGEKSVGVSDDLFCILAESQALAEQSHGAFDVTVGRLVKLWRHARRTGTLPDKDRLAEALELTGFRKLHLDPRGRSVKLDRSGMLLDLGGIAKGYAVDEAMKVLRQHGLTRALVAAGGDILAGDPPPGRRGWVVGIAPLDSPDGAPTRYLLLRERAVSTSGDARQYVEIAGVRYSHIIDPRTGMPLTGHSSVTVVARTCRESDGLATAASVLGPAEGSRLVDSAAGAAALFLAAGNGSGESETGRWKQIPKAKAREALWR